MTFANLMLAHLFKFEFNSMPVIGREYVINSFIVTIVTFNKIVPLFLFALMENISPQCHTEYS